MSASLRAARDRTGHWGSNLRYLHVDLDVSGRPATLLAPAAITGSVIDLRAQPVLARLIEPCFRLGLHDILGVAAIAKLDPLVVDPIDGS